MPLRSVTRSLIHQRQYFTFWTRARITRALTTQLAKTNGGIDDILSLLSMNGGGIVVYQQCQ